MFSHDHHISSNPFSRHRGATLARLITPLAVVALLAVTAWLEFDSRATAEDAVRQHAAAAASRYSEHIATILQSHLTASTAPLRERLRLGDSLPHPRVLSEGAWRCDCGAIGDVLFAFQYDFDDGRLVPDRDLVAPVLRSLARHAPQALPQITENAAETADVSASDSLRRTAMIAFDTVASQPFVLAYALVADATNRPRALYGVATDPKEFREAYERLAAADSLLPRAITNGRPNDSLVVIRTADPTSGTIFVRLAPLPAGAVVHTDTLDAWLGGQVVTVAIRPELVKELMASGAPGGPRPLQLTLLGIAAVLSLLALWFRPRRAGRFR